MLPPECHVRIAQLYPSCPVWLLCLVGSSQRRPLCQTGNTLGRCDGWFPDLSQLEQSCPCTSELQHRECTCQHAHHLAPKNGRHYSDCTIWRCLRTKEKVWLHNEDLRVLGFIKKLLCESKLWTPFPTILICCVNFGKSINSHNFILFFSGFTVLMEYLF